MKKKSDLKVGRYYFTTTSDKSVAESQGFHDSIVLIHNITDDGTIQEQDYFLDGKNKDNIRGLEIGIDSVINGKPFEYYILTEKESEEYKLIFTVNAL
ncbi:MAG TPA: hypothetical protein VIR31_05900 [Nitrososphaeraceae archaeon]